jgi:hypothetical protein
MEIFFIAALPGAPHPNTGQGIAIVIFPQELHMDELFLLGRIIFGGFSRCF